MKTLLSTVALLLTFTMTMMAQFSYPTTKVNPRIISKPIVKYPTPNLDIRANCPDLAADIKVTVVRKTSQFCGLVKIEAKVRNAGKKNFSSRSGQASIMVYEEVPGRSPKLVKRSGITNVAVGRSYTVYTTYRTYCSSNEFPTAFRACIGYDPDIRLDGNPNNDDCVSRNNCKTMSGYQINKLVSPGS